MNKKLTKKKSNKKTIKEEVEICDICEENPVEIGSGTCKKCLAEIPTFEITCECNTVLEVEDGGSVICDNCGLELDDKGCIL